MLRLDHFPAPTSAEKITTCENDGHLQSSDPMECSFIGQQWFGNEYINITSTQETARPASSRYEARDAFYSHSGTALQRAMAVYYEEGLTAALKEVLNDNKDLSSIYINSAKLALKFITMCQSITNLLPWLTLKKYISGNTPTSPALGLGCVLNVSWHPHTATLAILYADDTIRVFGKNRSLIPVLKHRLQKRVTQLDWMPNSASLLCVNCEGGVLLWTLDPVSVVTRPSGSCLTPILLKRTRTTPSFTWHPQGLLLLLVGSDGHDLVVCDVAREVTSVAHSGQGTCYTSLLCAPNGNRLFAAMNTHTLKVFNTCNWRHERWNLTSPVQAVVWASSGLLLLFATQEDTCLYCLTFVEDQHKGDDVGGASLATLVVDLAPIYVCDDDGQQVKVGGRIEQLAWDPSNERLAVLFKDSDLIAVFASSTFPQLHLAPGGFIRGKPGRRPLFISFMKNVKHGAVLTIVWCGGEVQHLPMRFTNRQSNTELQQSCIATPKLHQNTPVPLVAHNTTLNNTTFATSLMSPGFSSTLNQLFTSPT